ncbi:MAG: hypothetical protein H0V90_10155 [Blastocatellia bacterium]|nr:hypothetical protein [Blastocatellia bacterium]
MIKKLTIFVVSIVIIGFTVFAFSGQINFPVTSSAQSNSPEVPDNIAYHHLFRHVAAFKTRADELERQGRNAAGFRGFFKRKANLSDGEALILEQLAMQCALEIKAIDERAKPIILAYRAQYPNGQVPHNPPSVKNCSGVFRNLSKTKSRGMLTRFTRNHNLPLSPLGCFLK